MQLDFMGALTCIGAVLGLVSLLLSSGVGGLRAQVGELRRELGELKESLKTAEKERDTHKTDLEAARLKIIELLDVNRALHEQLSKLKDSLLSRARARKTET